MSEDTSVLTLDSLRGKGLQKGGCTAALRISTLSPENQEVVNQALAGPEFEFPSTRIATALKGLRVPISVDTIIKHRRGLCACSKPLEVRE